MANTKSQVAMVLGVVIVLADLYWLSFGYKNVTALTLGVIIFIASAIWMYIDYSLMKGHK